jgi:hypothetical protein
MSASSRRAGRLFLAALVSLVPAAIGAQAPGSGGSVLMLLPSNGRLEVGAETRGALSAADFRSARDTYLDAWDLEGSAGDSVTVDVLANDFDAYVYVTGPGFAETLSDDDSGEGCHARLTFTMLESGAFRVVVSSSSSRQTGVYTVRVSERPPEITDYPCGGVNPAVLLGLATGTRTVAVGDSVTGMLSSSDPTISTGRYAQAWSLQGRGGRSVTITVTSEAFDTFVYVVGPGLEPQSDDDSAGELNSQLTVTLPQDGSYRVVVTSAGSGGTGAYVLRVAPQ